MAARDCGKLIFGHCLWHMLATLLLHLGVCLYEPDANGHVVVPNGVTTIGRSAFAQCSTMISIDLPESLTTIEYEAFGRCVNLKSITVPNSVTSIANYAFARCTSLESIVLPNGITSIGGWVFKLCTSLSSITIPSSVTSIGLHAFEAARGLVSVNLPEGLTSIGNFAFWDCFSLSMVCVPLGCSVGDNAFLLESGAQAPWTRGCGPPSPPPPQVQDGAIIEMTGDDPKFIFGTLEDPTCQLSVDRPNSRILSTCAIQDSRRRLEEAFDCQGKYAALEQKYQALQSEVSELRGLINQLK